MSTMPNLNFLDKVVLITGSSSGIGAAAAIEFSKSGAKVVITGRNEQNLKKVAEQCTSAHLAVQADLAVEEDVESLIKKTIDKFGKLDVLINNAGIIETAGIQNGSLTHFDKTFNTNLRAVYQLTQLAVPHLIKSKGNIVNVSSLAGIRAFAVSLTYCMSKAALDHFTRCISLELAPLGVRVNSVNPGVIETEIFGNSGMNQTEIEAFLAHHRQINPSGRIGKTEDVVSAIKFLASDQADFVTGVIMPIDGGRGNVCPR